MSILNIYTVTAAIADPVRLSVMIYLMRAPASVNEMTIQLDVSQSNLSNHLAVLKSAGLVRSLASGRQKIYELANAEAAQLIEVLMNMQPPSPKRENEIKPIQHARTCYDHLAGKLGVGLFDALIDQGAVSLRSGQHTDKQSTAKNIVLGPNGTAVFQKLGVMLPLENSTKRKFAFGCTDWTERTPHLGGALGAALCNAFFSQEWIIRSRGNRSITITTRGKHALKDLLGLEI